MAGAATSTALATVPQAGLLRRVWDAIRGTGSGPRGDSWRNWLTGAGTWQRDKGTHTHFSPLRILQWGECESLYYGDWISAKIVDARPDEYFRRGFELEDSKADTIEKDLAALGVRAKFRDAVRWARIWGGAAAVCMVDDGLSADQPVNLARSRGVKWINIVDRRYVNPITYYDDPTQPNFGLPQMYELTPAFGQSAIGAQVHESRIIRFTGTHVDPITARRLAGWSYSAMQRPYDVIRRIAQMYQAAGQLMYDASQGVLKVSNLVAQMSGPQQAAFLQRLQDLDMGRWSGRTIAVDKDGEDYERKATPFAGIPDIMDRIAFELGGATSMPLTRIFGRSPAGMNATGESDQQFWYETVGNEQKNEVEPAIVKLLSMLTAGKWDGKINWLGLERPNDKEEAEVETERAKRWQLLVDMGAVSGEQVALVELADKPLEDVLDVDTLEELVEQEYEQAKEPQPMTPPLVTGQPLASGSVASNAASAAKAPGGPPPAPAAKGDAASDDVRDAVREQLLDDYAEKDITWIDQAKWTGPKPVPLDQINTSGRQRWRATKEPDKVHKFAKKQKRGELKPIVLVKTPGSDLYDIIDGHHRTLAAEELERPVLAYIGTVSKDAGPWDNMHASQRSAPSLDSKTLVERIRDFADQASQRSMVKPRRVRHDHIVQRGGKWVLLSKKDPSKVLGTFESETEAKERERQIIAAQAAKGE